jgi:hypothetical protein
MVFNATFNNISVILWQSVLHNVVWNKMYIFILKQRYYVTEIISFTKIMWPLIRAILFKHTFHSSKAL